MQRLVVVLLLAGCGGVVSSVPDAAVMAVDAGPSTDAGALTVDAGEPPDASVDAGAVVDAGLLVDAGTPADAGRADAGVGRRRATFRPSCRR
jgi:hypothetical protein